MARDEIEKAVEVADKMSDNRVIEKLRYLTKDGGQKLLRKTEVDSFTNIKTLEETTDKKDKVYIYKMNCQSVLGGNQIMYLKLQQKLLKLPKKWNKKKLKDNLKNH